VPSAAGGRQATVDLTPGQIFEAIDKRVKANPAKARAINAVYQFNLTGDQGGTWTVDCTVPGAKSGATQNPGCTFTISDTDFVDLVQGRLNPQMAFMAGKLKIGGNMALAMKLPQVLGG
jgi:putative sterol carrier protein